jgi:hypothetical protein
MLFEILQKRLQISRFENFSSQLTLSFGGGKIDNDVESAVLFSFPSMFA